MKLILSLALLFAALGAHAAPRPQDFQGEFACESGNIQAVIYIKTSEVRADGFYLEAPAVAKIKVISLHPRRTLMNETRAVTYTKFKTLTSYSKGPGLFVGQLFDNKNVIYNKNGKLVFSGSPMSCLD